MVGNTERAKALRTAKDEDGNVTGILKDEDGNPVPRLMFFNNVLSQDINTTISEGAGTWSHQASISMDGMFVPYGGVFVSGQIDRDKNYAGTGGLNWENGQKLAFTPFNFLQGNGTDTGEKNEWGYDAYPVAGSLPTREWPEDQVAGQNINYRNINSLTLNPFNYGNNIKFYHRGKDIVDPRNAPDYDEGFDYSVQKTYNQAQKGYDPRAVGFRAPMMLVGWGYDTNGEPVPNASHDKDPVIYDQSGEKIIPERTGADEFLEDYQWRMDKWKAGPLDVRWDRERKVWTGGGGGADIHLMQASRCFNFAGWEQPYDTCLDGNPQCCFTDESGMGIPEPPFYGGNTAEFTTCCPGSNCKNKQCATNYWTCDSCDNVSICVTKVISGTLEKARTGAAATGRKIYVDDVTCLRKAITGLGVCTGAPQHRTRQDCEDAGLRWVPSQGNTIHVMVSKDLDDAFAGNPSLKPDLPNLTGGVSGAGSGTVNHNGTEVIKISDVQFTDPKCTDAKCPGWIEIAPDTGTPPQNRGLSAPTWQQCPQEEWNPCMPQGTNCAGATIDEEGMRARGCPSTWSPPYYIIGPGLAFHDAIEIRRPGEAPNGYSTNSPPDWEEGHKETPTSTAIQAAVVENVLLHSLKRSQFFYGLKTGRARKTLVDVRAGSNPVVLGQSCTNNDSSHSNPCGTANNPGCCCEDPTDISAQNAASGGYDPDNDAAYGTGCEPVEIYDTYPVYWIMQAEFEYKNFATKVTCDPDTFEITVCTRRIPVEGGVSCEYCPGFTSCLSGDETSGVANLY